MAKRKTKKEILTDCILNQEIDLEQVEFSIPTKVQSIILAEPFFQRSEKMVKRYYNQLSKYEFIVMKPENFNQINSSIVLVMDEFSFDLSSLYDVKNEFIVIISDSQFIKKTNTIERVQCLFLNDFKLLFNIPVMNPNCIIYVYKKLNKTIHND